MSDAIDEIELVDTPIELEVYKMQCKQKMIWSIFKFLMLCFALIGSTILGILYDGQYLTYTYVFYGIVVSFAIGQNISMESIADILKR